MMPELNMQILCWNIIIQISYAYLHSIYSTFISIFFLNIGRAVAVTGFEIKPAILHKLLMRIIKVYS